jgi:hypothetical protein
MIEKAKNAPPLGSLRAEKPRRVQLHVLVDRKSERIATLTESRMQYRESRRGRSGWLLLPRTSNPSARRLSKTASSQSRNGQRRLRVPTQCPRTDPRRETASALIPAKALIYGPPARQAYRSIAGRRAGCEGRVRQRDFIALRAVARGRPIAARACHCFFIWPLQEAHAMPFATRSCRGAGSAYSSDPATTLDDAYAAAHAAMPSPGQR